MNAFLLHYMSINKSKVSAVRLSCQLKKVIQIRQYCSTGWSILMQLSPLVRQGLTEISCE